LHLIIFPLADIIMVSWSCVQSDNKEFPLETYKKGETLSSNIRHKEYF